jgi:predicted nucleic acid-binding protein
MGQINLPRGSSVYIDSVVIIYTLQANPSFYELIEPMWVQFQARNISIVCSELAIPEVLVSPRRSGDLNQIGIYENLLFNSGIDLMPIDREILLLATELRVKHRLKTPDAIHAATSISANCRRFITNDRDFCNIAGLPVVVLNELLNDR